LGAKIAPSLGAPYSDARGAGAQGLAAQGFFALQGLAAQGFFALQGLAAQGFFASHGLAARLGCCAAIKNTAKAAVIVIAGVK